MTHIGATLRLVLVMALWAGCFPLIALGLDSAPHLAFASMRAVLAGACLLGLGSLLGRPLPASPQTWALLVLAGLGTTTLGFIGMFHAAEFVAPGLATVIANVQPLLAAILAYIFLAERPGRKGAVGLAIGFSGIVAIAWPGLVSSGANGYTLGIAYILLSATGVAVGNVVMKRLAGKVDELMAMGVQLVIGGIPLALLSLSTEDISRIAWSTDFVLALMTLSLFVTALAFWLWFSALKETELNRANAFTFLVPIFGLSLGVAFFGERPGWSAVVGGTIALLGIALVQRDAHDREMRAISMHPTMSERR